MNNFEKLFDKLVTSDYNFGTGVWSAVNDNIQMKMDDMGKYVPFPTKESHMFSNEEIELLEKVSIALNNKQIDRISKSLFSNIKNVRFDQRIGYYSELYVGHVVEGEFRKEGSSGGFGTWVLKELFEKNYIDGVIHVKETNSKEKLFKYDISTTVEEIVKGSKTRYYPVELSEVLKLVKEKPGSYAIIGLPSFISSVRLLSEVDPVINDRIKFTIGLVCGHQKTTKFGEFLAWQCGIEPGNLEKINFRKKLDNAPASSYAIQVTGKINGVQKTVVKEMKSLFGGDWGQGLFKIKASDFTDDVMNETADITLGDAWLPEYSKDSKGNNIIIVRNPIIHKILKEAITRKKINVDSVDSNTIYRSQISHYRHTQEELTYRIYREKKNNEWVPETRVAIARNIPYFRKKIQNQREKIRNMAPLYYEEAVKKNDLSYFIKKMTPLTEQYKNLYRMDNISKKIKNKLRIKNR